MTVFLPVPSAVMQREAQPTQKGIFPVRPANQAPMVGGACMLQQVIKGTAAKIRSAITRPVLATRSASKGASSRWLRMPAGVAMESRTQYEGQPSPNPGLIHWLPLHGHGVDRVTGDCLQMSAPAQRQCWVTYIHLVSGTFILLNWQQRSLNNPSGRSHTCTQQSVQPDHMEAFGLPCSSRMT
ncbi:MAG: hypothetical protein TQ37_03485 [Candidatus Synechococcus spongiarum 15L]|uniref:Uncharacterized protein n=1 Tax=Candidatus Synechococcus spongiarum 15L TaxID=1608419 RepID=A0A0G8AWS3_9SYNE|nr:MAG: hypothetical protein TQ37_03485 [Candidatus Synechococcus spongiarum 15L]